MKRKRGRPNGSKDKQKTEDEFVKKMEQALHGMAKPNKYRMGNLYSLEISDSVNLDRTYAHLK